jgi:hypothetical protein
VPNEVSDQRQPTLQRPPKPTHTYSSSSSLPLFEDLSDQGFTITGDPSPSTSRVNLVHLDDDSTSSVTPSKKPTASTRGQGAKRMTKKVKAEAEAARLESYAEILFSELNKAVFQNKLPQSTKLVWSKRLLTTAGKAKWHR